MRLRWRGQLIVTCNDYRYLSNDSQYVAGANGPQELTGLISVGGVVGCGHGWPGRNTWPPAPMVFVWSRSAVVRA